MGFSWDYLFSCLTAGTDGADFFNHSVDVLILRLSTPQSSWTSIPASPETNSCSGDIDYKCRAECIRCFLCDGALPSPEQRAIHFVPNFLSRSRGSRRIPAYPHLNHLDGRHPSFRISGMHHPAFHLRFRHPLYPGMDCLV